MRILPSVIQITGQLWGLQVWAILDLLPHVNTASLTGYRRPRTHADRRLRAFHSQGMHAKGKAACGFMPGVGIKRGDDGRPSAERVDPLPNC